MTSKDNALLSELFQWYGRPAQEAQFQIHGYFRKAESINKTADVQQADKHAAYMIEELQHKIDQLKAYRLSLADRYGFLETAPSVPVVRLTRKRDYSSSKVHYYLCTYRRFVDSETEVEESRREYPGTERNNAIKDFHAYTKAHPGIISEMDIQKGRWEK